ncbi:MAG: metallophosphoesterase [Bacilli bacterium]|nr:metallophosphoesterase [Bacilli bacterium]
MRLKLKWKIIFVIIILLILLFILGRYIGNSGLKVREYKVINKNLKTFYGMKIVHFSDLHYGNIVKEEKLKKLVKMINKTKPDIVIFTGDLIAKNVKIDDNVVDTLSKNLSHIESIYGKYYVTGNNDKSNKYYEAIMNTGGFKSIDETYDIIYSKDNKSLFIAGVDVDKSLNSKTIESLNMNEYDYKILALHYPDKIDDNIKYNFDLILAGHSLNGQVRLPVIGAVIKPQNAKKYYDPYYRIDNTSIYITNGIGNNSINYRLLNTPSFNLYRLVDK